MLKQILGISKKEIIMFIYYNGKSTFFAVIPQMLL